MIDWTHWHNEPILIGGLIFLGWLYAILTGPLRGKLSAVSYQPSASGPELPAPSSQLPASIPYPRSHAIKFYAALVVFYLAVGSPLDQLGERYLLSAHMLQHQLIIYPAAVLFLLGLPDWLVRPLTGRPGLRPALRVLTHPVVCGTIYISVLSIWHLPSFYDLALQNRLVHIAEHFMFFGAGLFYWWPVLSPATELPRVSFASQIVYLTAVVIGMTPLFAYIAFAPDVLYPTYEFAPLIKLFGVSMGAAGDQLLAGAMMKLIGMSVGAIASTVSFYRWYQANEAKHPALGKNKAAGTTNPH
ncbi:cytochrome c oxidase assembly protein [Opitutus sp. GAS368]|uniref:cytochrome c oxidase assembly protein n=1 Tax=Opitutus sp. GAS368 TaxID=1882749 RepID=UPI00087AE1E9|nr:cytochrome c oxidase assembly protein [Opitutus sp. GAS368]SDR71047.1 putative membrane protein [Opitutus sp. GAS368]